MKNIVCRICGYEFKGTKESHYISRDGLETGIATIAKNQEPKLYDTFDCPFCGCQYVAQERKNKAICKGESL